MADDAPPAAAAAAATEETTASTTTASAPVPAPIVIASAVPAGMLTPSGVSTPGGPATGTVTPAMSELPLDQVEYSLKVSLADICAKAAVLYSQQKNYEEAAELYARAAEMQAEMNGEMDPENGEILFLYGRALFKVGQSKSDVLGGKAPETEGAAGAAAPSKKTAPATEAGSSSGGIIAKAVSGEPAAASSSSGGATKEEAAALEAKKPLFQFAGDEEWDVSDEEEGENAEGDENNDDEEEDDLAVAFEVLDLSRVLFEKQLEGRQADETATEAGEESKGKEAETAEGADKTETEEDETGGKKAVGGVLRHILERLADTHDLLAEISLENERYPNAIVDSRASLAYKKRYLPEESEIIAEAHFKLSLALEFASVTQSADGEDGAAGGSGHQQVDQELRDEAARELEAAIASTKLKLQNKEVELATLHSPEDNDSTRRQIVEVKDIIADMEQRLVDLRKPPIDLNAAVNGPAGAGLGGLLGALSGAGGSTKVEEAKKAATDLTGLVRKKAKDVPVPAVAAEANGNGNGAKRKADAPEAGEEDEAKKARTAEEA